MMTSIYVLPTEEGLPPRALLMDGDQPEPEAGEQLEGMLAIWTADVGCWTLGGTPLPQELSDAITEHAKDLGVEW